MPLTEPPDRCPYHRRGGRDLGACPAYQRSDFAPFSIYLLPLAMVVTCGHLAVGSDGPGRFYPACRLGDATGRETWVARIRVDHVALARSLQEDLATVLGDRTLALWALKGRQLAAQDPQTKAGLTAEMTRESVATLEAIGTFLHEHGDDMATLETPPDLCMELFGRLMEDWVASTTTSLPALAPDILERFPAAGRLLVDPTPH